MAQSLSPIQSRAAQRSSKSAASSEIGHREGAGARQLPAAAAARRLQPEAKVDAVSQTLSGCLGDEQTGLG